jgi:ABC-type transport system involved in multi-copper enzyme maturation permease subunit
VALGFFIGILFAAPIVSLFAGPSPALNYVPGGGVTGTMLTSQGLVSVGGGTDNVGANLITYILYPSGSVDFNRTSLQLQGGQANITQTLAYSEPISLITSRSVATAATYTIAFLVIAWVAFKRAQVLE